MNTAPDGWHPDPIYPTQRVRWWDGTQWTSHYHDVPVGPAPFRSSVRTARTSRGAVYWLTVGWFIGPTMWAGRVLLWVFVWPLGLWRSLRHSQRRA